MIELTKKKTNPLFVEFKVTDLCEEEMDVLLLWEEDLYKSCIFSQTIKLKNNFIYFSEINKNLDFFENDITFKIINSNFDVLFEYTFKKFIFEPNSKILYISQYSNTGYGYAARNYIYQLITNGFTVHWKIDECDNYTSTTDEEKQVFNTVIKEEDDEYDYVIIHHIPESWEHLIKGLKNKIKYKKIFGLTTWETNRLCETWINIINNSPINEVIVHSKFNTQIFKQSGIIKPIYHWYIDIFPKLKPDKIIENKIYNKCILYKNNCFQNDYFTIENIFNTKTIYYNISQFNERKNLEQLVRVFCKKFTSNDNVCLFIKTFFKEFTEAQKQYLKFRFRSILKNYKNIPDIVFCFEDLNDKEMQFIHNKSDVYFTLNRGEGFGLCTYTAKKFGNKVICGKFGAEKEFIDENDVLLDYYLCPTFNMYHYHNWYENQEWAGYDDDYVLNKLQYYPKK